MLFKTVGVSLFVMGISVFTVLAQDFGNALRPGFPPPGGGNYPGGGGDGEMQCRERERPGMICQWRTVGTEQRCREGAPQTVCRDIPGGINCYLENGRRICRNEPPRRDCRTIPGERICQTVPRMDCVCSQDPWGNPGHDQPWPMPDGQNDLAGFCPDMDHQQFMSAKSFAYAPNGLDLTSQGAINWALEYNQTHACNTMPFFERRFQAVKNFAYAPNYLDMTTSNARRIALEWVNRGFCGDENVVKQLMGEYGQHFNFAYSPGGLDMTKSNARRYALDQLERRFACLELFR